MHHVKISKLQALVYALIFAAIGAIIWRSFAASNPNLLGDLNNDNLVGVSDLSILLSNYNTANAAGDVNGDGTVGVVDLSVLLSHYGQSYSGITSYTPKYYVSPTGSDSNNGTSSTTPWKTISKIQNRCFSSGDVIAFQGGQTFSDTYLDTSCSGTSASPIVFTSYGTGKAKIAGGVWMDGGRHDITYDNLEMTDTGGSIFTSCGACGGNGSPIYNITLQNSYIHNTPDVGLQCNKNDHDWMIKNSTFEHTGDSGMILFYCSNITVTRNTITDTGFNGAALGYGVHGIYAKSLNTTISYNDISNNQGGNGLSIRTHAQTIFGNAIHDTKYPFAFFNYDLPNVNPGVPTYIYYNRMWNISGYAFFYAGDLDDNGVAPTVKFVFANNTFQMSSANEAFNVSQVPSGGSVTLVNNIITGSYGSAYRGCGTCSEHHNDWIGGTSNIPNGTADLHVSPNLSAPPVLALPTGSSLIDKGTTSVTGLTYSLNSDGQPLHYKGAAPDMGAVEF